jgi:hypothetical protein
MKMKKVICINNKEVEGSLKLGLEYEPIKENKTHYVIQLGNKVKGNYRKDRFQEV